MTFTVLRNSCTLYTFTVLRQKALTFTLPPPYAVNALRDRVSVVRATQLGAGSS